MSDNLQQSPDNKTRLVLDDKTRLVPDATQLHTQADPSGEPASHTGRPISEINAAQPASRTDPQFTQYTEYSASTANSSGFAKAQALAEATLATNGTLLKKRFVLESVLGSGGMGTVYKTRDLRKVEAEDPNPYIATKVLNQDFKDHPNAFVALQQEAAKSHTLAHPNIVTVHDFDRDGNTLFMTMELLEGEPMDQLLRAHRGVGLPQAQVFKLTQDMGAALSYAHQRHIIHSDFKPGNVFVTAEGAKVLDFGIARAASQETQKHQFDAGSLGALTPAYATIEMVKGEPPSFADDVYALAVVVYEMLSGNHPYERRSALQALELKLKPKRIESLSQGQWRALCQGLALIKNERTPTVNQFLVQLFPRRGAGLIKLAAGLAIISLLGAAWFGYQQYQAKVKIQNTIAEKLEAAQSCFAQRQFTCAIEQSLVVVSLDANNKVATALLKNAQLGQQQHQQAQRISELTAAGKRCLDQKDFACAQIRAEEILEQDPKNTVATDLLQKAKTLGATEEIAGLVAQAEECLAKNDLACATLVSEQINAINHLHADAQALKNKVLAAQLHSEQQQKISAQKIQALLNAGQKCLNQQNFECALAQANAALNLDKANTQAVELKQSASLARQQRLEAENKVAAMLQQAQECLDKKNYSCAIAKSEAALDIIPGHGQAQAIRNRAQDTQRRIKESGFNIR